MGFVLQANALVILSAAAVLILPRFEADSPDVASRLSHLLHRGGRRLQLALSAMFVASLVMPAVALCLVIAFDMNAWTSVASAWAFSSVLCALAVTRISDQSFASKISNIGADLTALFAGAVATIIAVELWS